MMRKMRIVWLLWVFFVLAVGTASAQEVAWTDVVAVDTSMAAAGGGGYVRVITGRVEIPSAPETPVSLRLTVLNDADQEIELGSCYDCSTGPFEFTAYGFRTDVYTLHVNTYQPGFKSVTHQFYAGDSVDTGTHRIEQLPYYPELLIPNLPESGSIDILARIRSRILQPRREAVTLRCRIYIEPTTQAWSMPMDCGMAPISGEWQADLFVYPPEDQGPARVGSFRVTREMVSGLFVCFQVTMEKTGSPREILGNTVECKTVPRRTTLSLFP